MNIGNTSVEVMELFKEKQKELIQFYYDLIGNNCFSNLTNNDIIDFKSIISLFKC